MDTFLRGKISTKYVFVRMVSRQITQNDDSLNQDKLTLMCLFRS